MARATSLDITPRSRRPHLAALLAAACTLAAASAILAQTGAAPSPASPAQAPAATAAPAPAGGAQQAGLESEGVPVSYRGQEVYRIYRGIGAFSAAQRAAMVAERLDALVHDPSIVPGELRLVHRETVSEIVLGERVVAAVSDEDAAAARAPRRIYAEHTFVQLRKVITETREELSPRSIAVGLATAAGETLAFLVVVVLTWRLGRRLLARLDEWQKRRALAVRIQDVEVIPADRLTLLLRTAVRWSRAVLVVVLALAWLEVMLHSVPWTRPYSRLVLGFVTAPLAYVWNGFVGFLPNLFYLLVIGALTYGVLRFVRFFFREIERERIRLAEFPAEWADPTYKIIRVLLIALALVAAFPYIPGSSSPAFQGVSIFLGLLVSLSSSSAISNVIAGTILTYTRAFRLGDRVRIGDTTGDVVRKSLLVTHVRTIKNVLVAIPNGVVLGSQVVNYSTLASHDGLILNTSVTIGYDAPWRTVHGLLISAARKTDGVLHDPAPFVLQTALNDFFVSYEINAYTREASRMVQIYSDLHANIQDAFNEAGVEIMSPHYSSLRDGNRIAIPAAYVGAEYETPGFRVVQARPADQGKAGE